MMLKTLRACVFLRGGVRLTCVEMCLHLGAHRGSLLWQCGLQSQFCEACIPRVFPPHRDHGLQESRVRLYVLSGCMSCHRALVWTPHICSVYSATISMLSDLRDFQLEGIWQPRKQITLGFQVSEQGFLFYELSNPPWRQFPCQFLITW